MATNPFFRLGDEPDPPTPVVTGSVSSSPILPRSGDVTIAVPARPATASTPPPLRRQVSRTHFPLSALKEHPEVAETPQHSRTATWTILAVVGGFVAFVLIIVVVYVVSMMSPNVCDACPKQDK